MFKILYGKHLVGYAIEYTSRSFNIIEIHELPDLYARTALHAKTVGFSGVQVHAGHGFLLSQFLSPLFNHRKDGYGGSIEARCRIVLEGVSNVPLMLTGGFKKRDQAVDAVSSGAVDMVGMARAMALDARISDTWRNHLGAIPYFRDSTLHLPVV